jgi:hypothetical protein
MEDNQFKEVGNMSNESIIALMSKLANLSKLCTDREVKAKIDNTIAEISDIVIERTGQ